MKTHSAEHDDIARTAAGKGKAAGKTRRAANKKIENRAHTKYTLFRTKCLRGECVTNNLIKQLIEQSASAVGGKCFRFGSPAGVRVTGEGSGLGLGLGSGAPMKSA